MNSMTGFGRGEASGGGVTVTVELKSVNNRFRDLQLRCPREYAAMEPRITNILKARFSRGRIDVTMRRVCREGRHGIMADVGLARAYHRTLMDLAEQLPNVDARIPVSYIAGLPGVLTSVEEEVDVTSEWSVVEAALNDVDMGAALIMCSAEKAAALGVPRERWVFPHSGADCHEHTFISNRWSFAETPAIELGGRRALELAGVGIDDIEIIDLYSCFPSAVHLGAQSLGISLDRQVTRTGGLAFAGGPWNNYVMHAIATVMADLRAHPGAKGLVWANGGYATKHSFGVYSTTPPVAFQHAHPQDEIDAMPRRELAAPAEAAGSATIEAYTVMFSRDGAPETALAACLLADGRRAWGTSSDTVLATAMCDGEWVGRTAHLDPEGVLSA